MRKTVGHFLERCRVVDGVNASDKSFGFNGAFRIPIAPLGIEHIFVICSDGGGWDHVSASFKERTPTWDEMCYIKGLFFDDHEAVFQFHPPKSDYINFHPHCLHLWRPQGQPFPLPPTYMVGPKSAASGAIVLG